MSTSVRMKRVIMVLLPESLVSIISVTPCCAAVAVGAAEQVTSSMCGIHIA